MIVKYINIVCKIVVTIVVCWGVIQIVTIQRARSYPKYSYHSGKVLDERTGKMYSVYNKRIIFDPSKIK